MRVSLDSPGLLRRSMKTSLFLAPLASLFIAVYGSPYLAGLYLLFTAWMLLNLLLWSYGVRELTGRRRGRVLFPLVVGKLSWLIFLVVLCSWVSVGEKSGNLVIFLLGFNTPFLVMSLKALGSMLAERPSHNDSSHCEKGINPPDGNHTAAD